MTFHKFAIVLTAYMIFVLLRRTPVRMFSTIQKEIDMTKKDLGLIVSLQSVCFTLSKLVFGIAVDKFSSVAILLLGLAVASTASILLAYAHSFSTVLVAVLAIGSVQGAAWIPATKLVAQWYEGPSFSTMFSLLGCGSTLSGLLLPLLGDFYWRDVSLYLGFASLSFGLATSYFLRTDYNSSTTATKNQQMSSSFGKIISSNVVWGVAMSYIFTLEARIVSETWLPLYLEDQQLPVSSFLVAYETAGLAGTVFSGFLLDQVSLRLPEQSARRVVGVTLSFGMLVSYMLSTSFPQHYISFGALCGFFTNASLNIWCLIASFAGEHHIAGSTNAFISFLANFGPILAGSPLSLLISTYGYSVFVPFFATQVALFLAISYMQIPLKMELKTKKA